VSEDATNGNSAKTYHPDDAEEPGISAEERGRRSWRQYLKRDNSFITDLFLGQFRSTLKYELIVTLEIVDFDFQWVVSGVQSVDTNRLHSSHFGLSQFQSMPKHPKIL